MVLVTRHEKLKGSGNITRSVAQEYYGGNYIAKYAK